MPCGPIYDIAEAYNDPQAQHLGLTQSVVGEAGNEIRLPRQPFSLSRTPSTLTLRTPKFAEHTDEVLAEFGFTEAEVAALRASAAIE